MIMHYCGNSSVVERQLPMLNVVGSSPISRFLNFNLLKSWWLYIILHQYVQVLSD
jgi:hypothetical protein